jgi:hypothetical protein
LEPARSDASALRVTSVFNNQEPLALRGIAMAEYSDEMWNPIFQIFVGAV